MAARRFSLEPKQVPRRFISITKRGLSTLMKAHSWEEMFRLYELAKEDNVDFNYVSIPDNYIEHSKEPFDPKNMKRLFDLGYEMAKSGYKWRKTMPGFGETSDDEWIWAPYMNLD